MKTYLHSQGKKLPHNLRVMWRGKQLNIRPLSPRNWKKGLSVRQHSFWHQKGGRIPLTLAKQCWASLSIFLSLAK